MLLDGSPFIFAYAMEDRTKILKNAGLLSLFHNRRMG